MAHTACLVCFIRIVNCCSKKEAIMTGASSGHITNLKQSILETFDINDMTPNDFAGVTFYCVVGAVNPRI